MSVGTLTKPTTVTPGNQYYCAFTGIMPAPVSVQNNDPSIQGAFVCAWLYPDLNPPYQEGQTLSPSGGGATLNPPGVDSSGAEPKAFILFNTGQAPLECQKAS
jgi:hypothetical protein